MNLSSSSSGIIGKKFPGGETPHALASKLAPDHRAGSPGRTAVVPGPQKGVLASRSSGLDVLQLHVLDAFLPVQRTNQL